MFGLSPCSVSPNSDPNPPLPVVFRAPSQKGEGEAHDVSKHVLSPQLVDAISQSTQVVWANCDSKNGLLGRSDVKLHTAVGLPVAVDSEGNMCVVVMFSPKSINR